MPPEVIDGAGIVMEAVTLPMRPLPPSVMYKFPAVSTAAPGGPPSAALVAGPPSPEKPLFPFPATVVRLPPGLT
jgi:hypothetical protein